VGRRTAIFGFLEFGDEKNVSDMVRKTLEVKSN
jgi:hypothetical protein